MKKVKKAIIWLKKRTLIRTRIRLFFQKIQIEKDLKENVKYKNANKGKRCFILGTGPSIKIQDLTPLKDEWTFAVAGFYLHPQYDIVHPKFFSILCSEVFKEDVESKKYLENVSKKVHEDTIMILPFTYKELIEKRDLFSKNKKIFLSQNQYFTEDGKFNVDIDKQIPYLQNIIFSSMITANYMGFKTMYLMGVEHDWLVKKSYIEGKTPYYQEHHFYEAEDVPKIPIMDIIVPYEETCKCARITFQTHRLLKQKMSDVKIFNLTPGSYLDVFPFKKYEEVMESIANEKNKMIPKSPITGKDNVLLEKEIPSSFLIDGYKREFGINVEKFFKNIKTVCLYRCLDTGYRFFAPFAIAGDDSFYQELQKFPWYYMDEKWEHGIASQFIKKNDKVLEIGCARGDFLKKVSGNGSTAEGLEMNSDALLECKKRGLAVYSDSIETFSHKKELYYDVVCSFQVLEHVPDVKSFLEASLAVLKQGGLMIVSVPNNDCLIFTDDSTILNMPPHHMGRWNINSLISLQNHFGIEVERIYFEPLQEYHLGYALKIANRSIKERLNKKAGLFEFLFRRISKLISYAGISAISKHLIGHSVLIVFKKK